MNQDIDTLLSLIVQLKRAFIRFEKPAGSNENIYATFLQSHVLFFLEKNSGATSNEIAQYVCGSPSSTTQLIERLHKAGLVSRSPDEQDRRVIRHSLTKEGLTQVNHVKKEKREQAKKIFSKLDEKDLKTLIGIIEKLLNDTT